MKKYRHILNCILLLVQIGMTIYSFYRIVTFHELPEVRNYFSMCCLIAMIILLFFNKNAFTLSMGVTLIFGNFVGLSAFTEIITTSWKINIHSLSIPVYWGQQPYTLLLLVYLIFNKEFYIGILTKEYWTSLLTRTEDLERIKQ